ncbi:translocation/assembly module TamB domain-containing protein [Aurantimonas coralicida]|uniref:translocation/assembly module TamB domain-containing protein n=1 Tax=Aurantimonas coralicida TaxID=182270 RepID=UPI001D18FB11|nr:translocation/assembly module TamB domain-containing protein [Aurantimonas coralicida]MCC4296198.1 translocation/assembly module TamB domain-containing protein [Aurantimonas coralicida]
MIRAGRLLQIAATLFLGGIVALAPSRPAQAQQFLATQIENLVSTDTMQVKIEGLSGALSGDIRIENVTVSDPQGVFLTASDLAMDWSPLSLVRSNVSIDALTAGSIVLERLPTGQPEAAPDEESGGFSLPSITADIRRLAIDEFVLGEAIAGTRARLRADASLQLAADPTDLNVKADIERLDQPGQIALEIGYAPAENQLKIDVKASEPAGGLVATLLDIPDRPAVDLTINGSGPLSAFMANGSLEVGAETAATLTARADDVDAGLRVSASLNVAAERLVPEQFQRYVAGGTALDLQMVIRDDGTYAIEQAVLSSDALSATAGGTLDLSGTANDLNLSVASRDGDPIPFVFGEAPGETTIELAGVDGTLKGALSAAALDLTLRLPRAGSGEYQAQGISAKIASAGFDLTGFKGAFDADLEAQSVAAPDGIQQRFLNGPVKIALAGNLTDTGLTFRPSEAVTDVANLQLEGEAALNFSTFALDVQSRFQTSALSAAMVPLAGEELAVGGRFARTPDGALSAEALTVRGDGLTIEGTAALTNDTVSADISGSLNEAGSVSGALAGAATFSLTASGPVEKPDVDLQISGNGLSINGRELADLKVEARGTLNPASPSGSVAITGTLDGQPLSGNATVETLDNGDRRITDLAIRQGPNSITGDLRLTDAFAPVGTLAIDVSDIGPLAALGSLDASGDVVGQVDLTVENDGMPVAAIDLTGERLSVAGNTLDGARIDLSVKDYLGIPRPTGTVTARAIAAPGIAVSDLEVALREDEQGTDLVAEAKVNAVPFALAGNVLFEPDTTLVRLTRLTADIEDAAIRLAEEAIVRIEDGVTTLSGIRVDVGDGDLSLDGSAGESLDLALRLTDVPAAAANPFVPGLAAAGTIGGTATVSGAANDPAATFAIVGTDLAVASSRAASVPAIQANLTGSYAGGTLTLQTARLDLGDGSLDASGTIGDQLDLEVAMDSVPVALANGFVDGLDAEGTLTGTATATGPRSDPQATFALSGTGITAEEIAAAGIDPLTLDVAGAYADGTATLDRAELIVGDGSLSASGTVGEELDIELAMRRLPVGLVNGFVPGLDASGTLSGTASASGSTIDPEAVFDVSGTGITTRQIARSGVAPLALRLTGTYADATAALETSVINVGDGSLVATGRVGQNLDLDVTMTNLPVGLANGFVDGLAARGTVSGKGTATGTLDNPTASFDLTGSGITADAIAESGIDPLTVDAAGRYADGTLTLSEAEIAVGDGSLTAEGTIGETLDLRVAVNAIPVGLANGIAPDLGAEGTISGTATATGSIADPQARFDLSGTGITTRQIAQSGVAPFALDAAGAYADGTATIERANLTVGDGSLRATGTVGEQLDLRLAIDALPVGLANGFVDGLGAEGTITGSATATGSLSDPQARFDLAGSGITTRQIAQSGVAPLLLDAAGSYANGTATIERADVTVGDGSLRATGTVGERLDIDVAIDALPVGLANGFVDGLGARGTISGSASATGSLTDPDASFDITASDVSVAQSRAAGAPALQAVAEGRYAGGTLNLGNARIDVGGGAITVTGSAGANALDITAEISALPASIASAAAAGIAPQGTINGTVRATGAPSNPSVTYDINASGVSIQQTRAAGVGALAVTTSGRFADQVVTTDTSLTGDGLDFSANGSVNLAGGPQLDLSLNGSAPLSLANRILAEGGRSVQGTVLVDARVTGPVSQPAIVGTVSTTGARFIDTGANLALNDISTTISLDGRTATIRAFDANLSAGGTLDVSGTVGLDGGFPADITIRLDDGRYNKGELVTARLDAELTITGPLTGTPRLAGTINAEEINVLVPENLPSSLARIDVTHRNAAPAVYEQQREISPERSDGGNSGGGIDLDLTFNAPNRVFVRGRGLDVELGGRITITGSAAFPNVVGGFDLQRGRFSILGKRLDFDRGRLSFTGGLTPYLDLVARSTAGDATVFITVTGPADDPSFNFSSEPTLPQDEVLARLIFGQGTSDLSPLQIAQLAEAAASLAGVGGSSGLLENLRSQLGVDDLDIRTAADGTTAVGVGKYLNENTYVGVDTSGRVTIDLDLGSGLSARGAVTSSGGGEVGVFYEGEF